jgi:hypothetical protein
MTQSTARSGGRNSRFLRRKIRAQRFSNGPASTEDIDRVLSRHDDVLPPTPTETQRAPGVFMVQTARWRNRGQPTLRRVK